jgi:hypothetical protein
MKKIALWLLPIVTAFTFLSAAKLSAQNTNEAVPGVSSVSDTNAVVQNTAIVPVPRDAKWIARHEGFVQEAQKGGIDILFMGDSITDGLECLE